MQAAERLDKGWEGEVNSLDSSQALMIDDANTLTSVSN